MERRDVLPARWGLASILWLQWFAVVARALTAFTDAPYTFQGYFVNDGSTQAINCGSASIFALSSTIGGCCPLEHFCDFPTACRDGTATNRRGTSAWSCGEGRHCYTMTVYDRSGGPDHEPASSWIVYNCAPNWSASTIYRTLPDMTTTTTTAAAATPTAGTAKGEEEEGDGDDDNGGSGGESKAYIAGIVLGSVAAAVALGGLGFWLGSRVREGKGERLREVDDDEGTYSGGASRGFAMYPVASPPGPTEAKAVGASSPVEMAATGRPHAELDASDGRRDMY
ncbi:hypothetical protein VTK26DRAFT_6385 [Humicola hyalothermophila]